MIASLAHMQPVQDLPPEVSQRIETVFTDIDDTLSTDGRIGAAAYDALWRARDAGLRMVVVTGRPAGWCDMIARMWPVDAVIGENGALAFALIDGGTSSGLRMQRLDAEFPDDATERLSAIEAQVLAEVPGCKTAADQAFRRHDLAIDFAEEVPRLDENAIAKIVATFEAHGATAKVSSIHVNGWFGDFDKLSMCRRAHQEFFASPLDPDRAIYVGDSPNDEAPFAFFPHAVGVANIADYCHRMQSLPRYVTQKPAGEGFAELIDILLRPCPDSQGDQI